MSFEQLMQHAYEIRQTAYRKAKERLGIKDVSPGQPTPRPIPNEAAERQRLDQHFADIPDVFQPFAEMPSPESLDNMIDNLRELTGMLASGESPKDPISDDAYPGNTELALMSGVDSYIEDWTGRAVMEFKASFVDPFPTIVRNQFLIAAVLKGALQAQREIWVRARNDIDKVAHDTLAALDGMDDCGKNEWTMTFTVLGAVVSIGAAPLSGGASVAMAAVAAASAVAGAAVPEDPPAIRFGGETAEVVVGQMREAVSVVADGVRTQESKIADALTRTRAMLSENPRLFVSARPALAEATARDITGPLFMGYSR